MGVTFLQNKSILIVDDEPDARETLTRFLKKHYSSITAVDSVDNALKAVNQNSFDIVLTDLVMPKRDGLELLDIMTNDYPQTPVIVISGNATFSKVVQAMQKGAANFIEKPILDTQILNVIIDKALDISDTNMEIKRLKSLLIPDFDASSIIAKSHIIEKVLEKVKRIANVDATVLLTGETGVGKDLFARLIVANSERKNRKFVAVNRGSIPETLLESMLFGHKKGAFTSAIRDQIGYFEEANGGTIFLDEITETSLSFQTKLLRVLENRIIRRVGDSFDIPINVRILTATNKNLVDEVKNGNFREDLYYRLNVIQVDIPPLRERHEDIEILSEHFLKEFANKYKKPLYRIEKTTMNILLSQYWKGNIRELKNVIEHAVVMATHNSLLPDDLPVYLFEDEKELKQLNNTEKPNNENLFNENETPNFQAHKIDYKTAKTTFEKLYLTELLKKSNGNINQAMIISKLTRSKLYMMIKKYELEIETFRNE